MQRLSKRYQTYSSTVSALRKMSKSGMRFDLSPMRKLSALLGDPWKNFPSILIAGTNGKGSTAAMLSEILAESGYTVGLYTSPHLASYRERLTIRESTLPFASPEGDTSQFCFSNTDADSARCISEDAWCDAFTILSESIDETEKEFTEFELLTALAFLAFREAKVDIAVLEAGLGGRLDAVNIVEPVLSLITSIDYDHKAILGETLPQIAYEKAGILRENKPALSLEQEASAKNTLMREAKLKKSLLSFIAPGRLLEFSIKEQRFEYDGAIYRQKLLGRHQVANASLALEASRRLKLLGYAIPEERIKAGILMAQWPARMEILSESPLVICDGAHNPQGCATLVENLNALALNNPKILAVGILNDKDISGMIQALSPWGDRWIVTRSNNSRSAPPPALKEIVQKRFPGKFILAAENIAEAARAALREAGKDGTVCFAGSLTVAAEARRIFKKR